MGSEMCIRDSLTSIEYPGPAALRFCRGSGLGVKLQEEVTSIPIGESELLREGRDVLLIALGPMVPLALEASSQLEEIGIQAAVLNLRFVKPMDKKKILELANLCKRIVTIEEGTKIGGMGAGVLEILSENKMNNIPVSILGIPDRFIPHGSPALQREDCGLTSGDITQAARDLVDIDDHIRSVIS